jgi:hypothetical protein
MCGPCSTPRVVRPGCSKCRSAAAGFARPERATACSRRMANGRRTAYPEADERCYGTDPRAAREGSMSARVVTYRGPASSGWEKKLRRAALRFRALMPFRRGKHDSVDAGTMRMPARADRRFES